MICQAEAAGRVGKSQTRRVASHWQSETGQDMFAWRVVQVRARVNLQIKEVF